MRRFLFGILLFTLALVGCHGGDGTSSSGTRVTITGMTPNQINPGTENIEGRITGTNLSGVTDVQLGPGVVVRNFSGLSASEIYIFFDVLRDATSGAHTISVVTAAGVAQSNTAFTVGDNRVPEAKFTIAPPNGLKVTNFKFDGSRSTDLDGSIVNYQWRLGDGSTKNGKVINHQFDRAGEFQVKLTVTDNRGATHESTRFMDVDASRSPEARFSVSPDSGNTNTTFQFNGSASRDPDGHVTGYAWSFGDGTTANGMVVEHKYSSKSDFIATLSVSDNTHQTSRATRFIHVDDVPPPPPPPPPGDDDDDDDDDDGGGGGGTCIPNDYRANSFSVRGVSGNVITADREIGRCSGYCGEIRRAEEGIREFVGDIASINGTSITFNPQSLPASTRPEVGETLYAVWRGCGH